MWKKTVLLAAILAFALPAIAGNPSNPKKPATVTNSKPVNSKPAKGPPQLDTLQFATGTPLTGSKATTPEAGQASLSGLNPVNCNQPNPPQSCKQTKPPH
jgi:hypothetical protein